jgi:outer membrane protein assembly factor BamE (lipoprotein component of BamABCDE complex)
MIEFALAAVLSNTQAHAIQSKEDVNKVCAYIVGIPYASDNFNDNEWNRFVLCRELMNDK